MKTTKRSLRIAHLILLPWALLPWALVHAAAQAPPPPNLADMKEFYNYTLTMDKIRRLGTVEKDLDALQKSDPQLRQSLESNSAAADLDQAAQQFQKVPQAVAVVKKNGFTPREYIVSTITFIQAAMAVGFKKNGSYKDYPPQVRQIVSAANLAFVEQHWDEIDKIMPSLSDNGAPQNGGPQGNGGPQK